MTGQGFETTRLISAVVTVETPHHVKAWLRRRLTKALHELHGPGVPTSTRARPLSPHWRGPEDDKDGQVAWFTARIASLIG